MYSELPALETWVGCFLRWLPKALLVKGKGGGIAERF